MPSQREIRRRIASVRNIKQITRAMQFVAASKLKRAQDATLQSRPYAEKIDEVLADLAAVLGARGASAAGQARGRHAAARAAHDRPRPGRLAQHQHHPLRRPADHRRRHGDLAVVTVGRKGQAAMRRARAAHRRQLRRLRRPADVRAGPAARPPHHRRLPRRHATTPVDLVYPRFISTLTQRPAVDRLLPIEPASDADEGIPGRQFIFEPNAADRADPAAAALRRDARLPGRPRADRERAVGAATCVRS